MNSKTLHIIGNEFTRKIAHPDEWWEHRIKIYEHYCLASIKNQTNKDFLLMLKICDYVPDKFQSQLRKLLRESGLAYIMFNMDQTTTRKAMDRYADEYLYVYYTRIDSDDMFHKNAIGEIQQYEFSHRQALLFQKGYCYDCKNNRLQHYFMPSPPFSTIMFPMSIYLDENKQNAYTQITSHDTIIYCMDACTLSENKFIVNVHGTNRISVYQNDRTVFKGHENETEIPTAEVDNILKDFGISSMTYKNKVQQ